MAAAGGSGRRVMAVLVVAAVMAAIPALGQMMAPAQMRAALETTSHQWVAFRNWQGQQLIYFTHLVAWKCAIREVRYAVNRQDPAELFLLPACDPQNPFLVDGESDRILLSFAPGEVKEISIQLVYGDGTLSAVHRFAPCEDAGDSACVVAQQ